MFNITKSVKTWKCLNKKWLPKQNAPSDGCNEDKLVWVISSLEGGTMMALGCSKKKRGSLLLSHLFWCMRPCAAVEWDISHCRVDVVFQGGGGGGGGIADPLSWCGARQKLRCLHLMLMRNIQKSLSITTQHAAELVRDKVWNWVWTQILGSKTRTKNTVCCMLSSMQRSSRVELIWVELNLPEWVDKTEEVEQDMNHGFMNLAKKM